MGANWICGSCGDIVYTTYGEPDICMNCGEADFEPYEEDDFEDHEPE